MSQFDDVVAEAQSIIQGIRSEDSGMRELSEETLTLRLLHATLNSAHLGAISRYADSRDQIIRELRGESPETADVEEETE